GGLALALARAAVGGRLGADIDLAGAAGMDGLAGDEALFAESAGRLPVAVSPGAADGFAAALAGRPCARIGTVEDSARLRVRHAGAILAELALPELAAACGARARLESTEASR